MAKFLFSSNNPFIPANQIAGVFHEQYLLKTWNDHNGFCMQINI